MASNAKVGYKIVYDRDMARRVNTSGGVMDELTRVAAQIGSTANAMGEGNTRYVSDEARPGRRRAHALVFTGNIRAMFDNARNSTLLKALKAHARR